MSQTIEKKNTPPKNIPPDLPTTRPGTKSPWIKGTWKTWPAETLMDRGDKASQQSEDRRIAAPKAAATFLVKPDSASSLPSGNYIICNIVMENWYRYSEFAVFPLKKW